MQEAEGTSETQARLIVTGTGDEGAMQRLRSALGRALPDARIRGTDFFGVLEVTAEGDGEQLAATAARECGEEIGHLVLALDEVQSALDDIRDAAVAVATERIGAGESFAFRLHKRGSHFLRRETPELEPEIGDAVGEALRERDGAEPKVDLEDPDVTVHAELLGPLCAVGIARKKWWPPSES